MQNDSEIGRLLDRRRSGRLDEVTGGRARGNSRSPRRPKNYEKIYARLEQQLQQAKKSKNVKRQKQLQAQLKRYRSRYGKPVTAQKVATDKADGFKLSHPEIVKQAKLQAAPKKGK